MNQKNRGNKKKAASGRTVASDDSVTPSGAKGLGEEILPFVQNENVQWLELISKPPLSKVARASRWRLPRNTAQPASQRLALPKF
jgi:hypothetical protein